MLTEEQKRKIEEKKTKALEKLQQKNKIQPFSSPVKEPSISITSFSPSFRKRPIENSLNSTKHNEPEKSSSNHSPFKTSFSPAFKKQKQGDQESNILGNNRSPPLKTIPNTSYSPKLKKTTNNNNGDISKFNPPTFRQSIIKSFDDASNSNKDEKESKKRAEENRCRALDKLKSKKSNSTITRKFEESIQSTSQNIDVIPLECTSKINSIWSPNGEKNSLPTSYSPSFKKITAVKEESKNIEKDAIESILSMYTNQPKTSFCSTFKNNAESFPRELSTTTTMPIVQHSSFSPQSRKTPFSISSTKSNNINKNLNNNCIPAITLHNPISVPIPKVGNSVKSINEPPGGLDVIEAKQRAEENRLKALEKLKNKQTTAAKSSQSEFQRLSQETETIEIQFSVKTPIWFKLHCTSNERIHAIVQKIENRNYDNGNWLFHIKDFKQVISYFDNIANIKITKNIPSSVVKILQYGHEEQKRKPLERIDISRIDENILEKLMSFQKTGVQFAVQKKGRVLIADDMGLGKTIQSIAICNYYIEDWPVLIICPSSVKMSWQQHFLAWMPTLRESDVFIIHTGKEMIQSIPGSVTIISCDLASKFADSIQSCDFQVIIVDESHSLKNSQAKRTKNLLPILQNARRTILLSGTPALSRPKELFTQISALRRELFKSYFKFAKRYCDAREGRFGLEDDGCSNSDELNAVLKSTIMLRRMKYEVLDQLPAKMRQIVVLDPSTVKISKQLKATEKAFVASKGKKDNRGPLLQFYCSTAEAKVKGVVQFIFEKLESTNEKIIVFAHHTTMLDHIEEETRVKKIESIRISGTTSSKARQVLVDVFNDTASCRLAILSLTAAGTGLNMTSCSLVIFAELYWNPGHLIQAEDRAHRIGQKNSVSVIYLIAKETADDYIWPLVKNKLNVLTNLGIGTKKGLGDTKYTESTSMKITNFFGGQSSSESDNKNEKELDDLFMNLKDTFDDDLMLEISQKSSSTSKV